MGAQAACLSLRVNLIQPAHTLDPNNTDDIPKTSKSLASDLIEFYDGDEPRKTPGLPPQVKAPGARTHRYGWESGVLMSAYLDYWQLTGDETYNDVVMKGLLHKAGENADFMSAEH
ncbi:hypothetical protein ACJ41O_007267 [Fusarium nematophilum]